MMREKYESLSLGVLKDLAKARDIKGTSTMKKAELVEAMLKKDEEEAVASSTTPARTKSSEKTVKSKNSAADEKGSVKDKKVSAKGEEAEEKSAEKVTEEKKPVAAGTVGKEESSSTVPVVKFLQDNKTYVTWIVAGIVAGLIIYLLISKLWRDKSEEDKARASSIALGSQASTRQVLSIGFGFLVFVGLFSSSLVGIEVKETLVKDHKKEVQGTQDTIVTNPQPMLNVIANTDKEGNNIYPIYEKANTASEVIYEAKENETFTVVEETVGWYKISLSGGRTGWVSKSIIKSINTREAN